MISLVSPLKDTLAKMQFTIFINSMIKESKYCSEVMKKHFNKELVLTKEDNKVLRTLLNIGSMTMIMLIMMLK